LRRRLHEDEDVLYRGMRQQLELQDEVRVGRRYLSHRVL
jgi:hypothetical protein